MKRMGWKVTWSAALVFGAFVSILPGLMIFWYNESPPVVYSTRKVLTPLVAPGETLKIAVSAELNKSCIAAVTRSLIDAVGTVWPKETERRPAYTNYTVEIVVPLGATPGPAKYRARVEWECNPLQHYFPYVILLPELDFEIAPTPMQFQIPQQQGIYVQPEKKSFLVRSEE